MKCGCLRRKSRFGCFRSNDLFALSIPFHCASFAQRRDCHFAGDGGPVAKLERAVGRPPAADAIKEIAHVGYGLVRITDDVGLAADSLRSNGGILSAKNLDFVHEFRHRCHGVLLTLVLR